eukprot:m.245744 g.245744  ORF g.245744 m.245744 type:complete len:854 (-) comp16109_c3_seq10:48-2609(-)
MFCLLAIRLWPIVLSIIWAKEVHANHNYAENIRKNVESLDSEAELQSTALIYGGDAHPLAVSVNDFKEMYEDNKDLWGDMPAESAYANYQRSMTGNVDSARLLMEFSMVPSVKAGGGELHKAAAVGDIDKVARLVDVSEGGTALVDPLKADGTTPLITAAMMGHVRVVQLLLEEGADPEKTGMNGANALHIAASMGHTEVMEMLIEHGANVNAQHKFAKSTALHFAAEMGQVEAVNVLCKHGADPESPKIQGGRPLHVAADSNQTEVAKILVKECKADLKALLLGDTTAMYLAAQKGFTGVVQVLLEAGADSNFVMPTTPVGSAISLQAEGHQAGGDETEEERMARYFRSMHQQGSDPSQPGFENGNGATALHAAVENGHIDVVRLMMKYKVKQMGSMEGATPLILGAMYNQHKIAEVLIEHGAQLNAQVPDTGNTALHHAVGSGYRKFMAVLLKRGVNIEVPNKGGLTPLLYACGIGRSSEIRTLLEHGANIEAKAEDGSTCLHISAMRGYLDIMRLLFALRPKLSVDSVDNQGSTALHNAARGNSVEMVRLLISFGSKISAVTQEMGATPLIVAAQAGRAKNIELLLDEGADLNVTCCPPYKATALYNAAQNGCLDCVKTLLARGANVNVRLTHGNTPLMAAAERGHVEVAKHLLSMKATINFRDIHGRNAAILAIMGKHLNLFRMLISAGGRVNVKLKDGSTVLHGAVKDGSSAIVGALLEAGADMYAKDKNEVSPLEMAQQKRDFELLKLFGKYEGKHDKNKAPSSEKYKNAADKKEESCAKDKSCEKDEEDKEEGDDELPQVVRVSRVMHQGKQYLVDKGSGIVYSNNIEDPQEIGKWTEKEGVILNS